MLMSKSVTIQNSDIHARRKIRVYKFSHHRTTIRGESKYKAENKWRLEQTEAGYDKMK